MRHATCFPTTALDIGHLEAPVDHGLTRGSGRRVTAVCVNPAGPYSVRVPVVAYGRRADELEKLAHEGALVSIRGRHANDATGALIVIVEEVAALDEPSQPTHEDTHA